MGFFLLHRHGQHHSKLSLTTISATFAFLLLASVSASGLNPNLQFSLGSRRYLKEKVNIVGEVEGILTIRRRLIGPGSSPPTCRSKCGVCSPCKPVRVTIEPGLTTPLEYYPQAWRCKCGFKLFMP
ncbi:hypothetical protein Leryth_017201 [Lithospermum erythrorhizon]|nr:hypothetical protein Leryth_017201 [Lithospermum erythrorhizon]